MLFASPKKNNNEFMMEVVKAIPIDTPGLNSKTYLINKSGGTNLIYGRYYKY